MVGVGIESSEFSPPKVSTVQTKNRRISVVCFLFAGATPNSDMLFYSDAFAHSWQLFPGFFAAN